MLWLEPMGSANHDEDKRHPDDALWRRIGEAMYKGADAVFRPPPPDVIQKIEDILGRAEHDWKKEEEGQCQDEANGKR